MPKLPVEIATAIFSATSAAAAPTESIAALFFPCESAVIFNSTSYNIAPFEAVAQAGIFKKCFF